MVDTYLNDFARKIIGEDHKNKVQYPHSFLQLFKNFLFNLLPKNAFQKTSKINFTEKKLNLLYLT